VPDDAVDEVVARSPEIGFPLDVNSVRASRRSPAPGEPHCNFSGTETKPRPTRWCSTSRTRFGDDIAGLKLHLTAAPTPARNTGSATSASRDDGARRAGNGTRRTDVFLRGGLGPRRAYRPAGLSAGSDRRAGRDGHE
jgi:hypothetical protein